MKLIDQLSSQFNNRNNLPESVFNKKFTILENKGAGNCLFHSFEHFTYDDADILRQKVCDFYKLFDFNKNYDDNTLQFKLFMQYLNDNDEHNSSEGHTDIICEPGEYAGIMDIIALAIILKRPVLLFTNRNGEYDIDEYSDKSVENNEPILISFNGRDHFEAIVQTKKSPTKVNKTAKTKKTTVVKSVKKTVKKLPKKSPSPSPKKTPSPKKSQKIVTTNNLTDIINNIHLFGHQNKLSNKTQKNKSKSPSPKKSNNNDELIGKMVTEQIGNNMLIGKVISFDEPYYKVLFEEQKFTKEEVENMMLA